MFDPSKYIDYKEMNAVFYNGGHRLPGQKVRKDGRITERTLSKWFIRLDESRALTHSSWLASIPSRIASRSRIIIIRRWNRGIRSIHVATSSALHIT